MEECPALASQAIATGPVARFAQEVSIASNLLTTAAGPGEARRLAQYLAGAAPLQAMVECGPYFGLARELPPSGRAE